MSAASGPLREVASWCRARPPPPRGCGERPTAGRCRSQQLVGGSEPVSRIQDLLRGEAAVTVQVADGSGRLRHQVKGRGSPGRMVVTAGNPIRLKEPPRSVYLSKQVASPNGAARSRRRLRESLHMRRRCHRPYHPVLLPYRARRQSTHRHFEKRLAGSGPCTVTRDSRRDSGTVSPSSSVEKLCETGSRGCGGTFSFGSA